MKRALYRTLVASMLASLMACYSGDGTYETKGVFLKSHKLTLHLEKFAIGGKQSFHVKGFAINAGAVQMSLMLKSPQAKKYWEMRTIVNIEIQDAETDEIVFTNRAVLPEYYQRVKGLEDYQHRAGEWLGVYSYDIGTKDTRYMPYFIPQNTDPLPQKTVVFRDTHEGYGIKWPRDYIVTVTTETPDPNFQDVEAWLIFSAGWK